MNQRDILDLLTRVHSAGQPDEDLNAVIPGDLWRELTDMQAKLLYEKHNPPEYVPSGPLQFPELTEMRFEKDTFVNGQLVAAGTVWTFKRRDDI